MTHFHPSTSSSISDSDSSGSSSSVWLRGLSRPLAWVVRFALLVALVFTTAHCGGPLGHAQRAYTKGRYADAKRRFVRLERTSEDWPLHRRARYALYRGLTHLALGDRRAASPWLDEAARLQSRARFAFSPDDEARLRLALETVSVTR